MGQVGTEGSQILESKANSIDILTIIGRYSKSVREFYEWFWLKIDEKMKPVRVECHAHVRELMAYGEEVFLVLAGHAVSIVDPDGRGDSNRCERWRQLANVTMFWSRIIWSVWSEEVRPGMRTSGTPSPSAASKSAVLAT